MTTPEKAEAILAKILEFANQEKLVRFERDWGDFTLTVSIDADHTHVGIPGPPEDGGTWDRLVDQLYNSFHGGPGLSWAQSKVK